MLNLGCGTRTNPYWVNIDWSLKLRLSKLPLIGSYLNSPTDIQIYDLRKGIPFDDNTVDVVYSSHVLEHIEKNGAETFLKEMYRVLKPGGVIRIVVPDLEKAARKYIAALDKVSSSSSPSKKDQDSYHWALIMLLDQQVRTVAGGEMVKWIADNPESSVVSDFEGTFKDMATEILNSRKTRLKNILVKKLKPSNPAKTGELHRWMYDKYSLKSLLLETGFKDVNKLDHLSSNIEGFDIYNLDSNIDDTAHQPDSIWMEGIK